MAKKTLRFNNIRVKKKKFDMSKEPIDLMSANIEQIVVSEKFNNYNDGYKYFIGYQEGVILPQMSGCIKCFEYGGMNMSFLIKNDVVCEKYKQI